MVRVMKETLRASDMIGRWGGDEFVVLLMNASSAEAEHTARRILDAVESHPLQAAGETIHRTVSIGLSTYTFDDPTGTRLIQHADDALLTAKDLGRNTIAKG